MIEDYNRRSIANDFDYTYDLINSMCGDFIAEGSSRIVYDCRTMPGHVVKIAKDNSKDNILEYEFYHSLIHQDSQKWLAPCNWISDNGKFMFQKKAVQLTEQNSHKIPDLIPDFLTDVKFDNFGFIGKQFVAIDYAFSVYYCSSNYKTKMVKFKSHLGEKIRCR